VILRPATPRDAAAIVALINPIIAAGNLTAYTTPWDRDAALDHLEAAPVFLIAEHEGKFAGFQFVEPFEGAPRVGDIATFVALSGRGEGVGRALMQATAPLARTAGFHTLNAEIRADNPGAQAYYAGTGFAEHARATRIAADGRAMPKIIRRRVLDTEAAALPAQP
jgi:L-amino acid N-acyltransferase YncA